VRYEELAGRAAAKRAGFPERLARTAERAWRGIGKRHPEANFPSLAIPESFAEWLGAALALHEIEPHEKSAHLELHYLELMPRMRVEQLATAAQPNAALFHTPLEWSALPRLSRAIDTLGVFFGSEAELALGAASGEEFRAARPTLAAFYERAYYGGFMPLLYGYPADLAAIARALDGGAPLHETLDRHLAAPLTHELSHLLPGRVAIAPPYLDECLAAWLGARAFPETAWPAPGEQHALYGAPWLAQTGQALARVFPSVLRAHAGIVPWSAALPAPLREAALRLGWDEYRRGRESHFLGSAHRPGPWAKLFFLAAARAPLAEVSLETLEATAWRAIPVPEEDQRDPAILDDALRAMCVRNFQVAGAYRVERAAPRAIAIDLARCTVESEGDRKGCDPHGLSYLFPPSTAARLRDAGIAGFGIELDGPRGLEALPAIAAAILDGAGSHRGEGYALTRRAV
jgi:hypothetical protein